ncbi:hypothetical protein ATANTOWER_026708 [Ataeniobius toweri]|uniref:Uncharacterized protein n=1 Tax=Ataeniobius toweri TaxID=208326 RepID=A0ABU7AHI9_9TELE|nr:hypothetical protein [Ataeniobius toweri]
MAAGISPKVIFRAIRMIRGLSDYWKWKIGSKIIIIIILQCEPGIRLSSRWFFCETNECVENKTLVSKLKMWHHWVFQQDNDAEYLTKSTQKWFSLPPSPVSPQT